jgi:hypothetical protein
MYTYHAEWMIQMTLNMMYVLGDSLSTHIRSEIDIYLILELLLLCIRYLCSDWNIYIKFNSLKPSGYYMYHLL